MEPSSYHDEKLEAYMLNELPTDEIAGLEDALLHNDDLFQRLEVVEMNLIDRYLENEMTGNEKRRFEAVFLTNAASRLKLDEARVFRESLKTLEENVNAASSTTQRSRFFDSIRLPQLAAAAVILIVIALVIVGLAIRSRNQQPNEQRAQALPPPTPGTSPTPTQQPSPSPAVSPPQKEAMGTIYHQWLYLSDVNTGVMGSDDDLLVSLRPEAKTLRLRFELGVDARDKNSLRVSIKDSLGYPALGPLEVTPIRIRHRGLMRRAISVDVPIRDLRIGERYRFEIADPNAFKYFMLEKK